MQPEPPTPSGGATPLRPCAADITEREGVLPRHDSVFYCPSCWAYLEPPRSWIRREPPRSCITATPGTADEVASIHLARVRRHIAGLGLTVTVSASFVSAKPCCPRRFRLHLRPRYAHEALDEQAHVVEVELTTHYRLCDACVRAQSDPGQWPAVVQVRQQQPSPSRRRSTLSLVDSLLAQYSGADSLLRVVRDIAATGVLDVHVVSRAHADRLVRFVSTVAPAVSTPRRPQPPLVSRADNDDDGRPYSVHVVSVDICPVCEGDLVLLSAEASRALGNLGPLVLCVRVTSALALLDTGNMRVVVVGAETCKRLKLEPLQLLAAGGRLVEYVVLAVEHDPSGHVAALGASFMMSWAQVVRASDVGKKDAVVLTVKTHLGYDLETGCHALGYDLCGGNGNDAYGCHGLEKYGQSHTLPAVVLTTRYYEDEDWEESAGEMRDGSEGGGRGGGGEIEEVAAGIGCIDLNQLVDDDKDATMAPF